MVPMLLAFAHPCPIFPPHVQLLQAPINHNIMMFHDCPQQNRSYLVTWDEDSPLVLTTLYCIWECNDNRIICNIQHPSWMIFVTPWTRLVVCIPKLLVPIIGHEQPTYTFIFSIGIWSPLIANVCIYINHVSCGKYTWILSIIINGLLTSIDALILN